MAFGVTDGGILAFPEALCGCSKEGNKAILKMVSPNDIELLYYLEPGFFVCYSVCTVTHMKTASVKS